MNAGMYTRAISSRRLRHESILIALLVFISVTALSQTSTPAKEVTYHHQSWMSINSVMRFSDHWGLMADFHVRKDDFMAHDYFYFVRLGAVTWINGKYPLAYGVAHLWQAPKEATNLWTNENRIYQQWSASQREGIVSVLHRVRFEQRWREIMLSDTEMARQFSFRLRYLASFDIRPFKNQHLPSLVLSDEILVQFGKEVLNTFDQNRLFVGLKVPISRNLNCDIGYMNILQQRVTSYRYDSSDVFRLFLYYNLDFRKNKGVGEHFENSE
jgi:hypothetical protein